MTPRTQTALSALAAVVVGAIPAALYHVVCRWWFAGPDHPEFSALRSVGSFFVVLGWFAGIPIACALTGIGTFLVTRKLLDRFSES